MEWVDSQEPIVRVLIREYGLKIVFDMMHEGYTDPFELQDLLEVRRDRRQQELLAQDHITERVKEGFRRGFQRMR